ncbi:STAS domain-containing protein [Streptomyces sp. NPDC005576]|uniref:STAS domain-containing protein n=1 Tax=Streptomyces sp. NPDC005576 TaxID=3364726 RepID=UPI0036B26B77
MTTFGAFAGGSPLPVIAPHGEFDADTLEPLERDIEAAIASHGGLILDAGNITFGDSTFLQLILTTHQRGWLRIAAPTAPLRRLFSVTGTDMVLHLHPDVTDAALAASMEAGAVPRA